MSSSSRPDQRKSTSLRERKPRKSGSYPKSGRNNRNIKSTKQTCAKSPWKIHCTIESKALGIAAQSIRAIVRKTLALVSDEIAVKHVSELHVMIINDAKMREINFEFRKKNKPTDVLSFPQYTPKEIRGDVKTSSSAGSYLGDLVISSETTIRQAKRFAVPLRAELTRLIVHGILHLIGYDHEDVPAREAQAMRRREQALRDLLR